MNKALLLTLPRARDDRGIRVGSTGASALVHGLMLALLLAVKVPTEPRPGPAGWTLDTNAGVGGGGGGAGGEVSFLQLPAPSVAKAVPDLPALPALPSPVAPSLPDLAPPAVVFPPMVAFESVSDCFGRCEAPDPGVGAGAGAGAGGLGAGLGPGSGTGSGPGRGTGSGPGGDGVRPPAPLTILIPPAATAAVRGGAATVRLQVDTVGAVRDADVVVSSGDRGYDEALRRIAMGWRFRPARDAANRPVPYPFEVSLAF